MRLIDADALAKKLTDWSTGTVEPIDWSDIAEAPTIDAVEVVRCKDCIYGKIREVDDKVQVYCDYQFDWWNADGYCSYGERKESE